ncbi:hypothetical protein C1H46_036927 [Malus baccata]|uniref:Uncharacterized protein n=1 Tax=Malus baccata TaxID=106549 RepID=A0A540KTI4_MALBA|nr:hypothetical protein C1H46_036927 [Malus baccata]
MFAHYLQSVTIDVDKALFNIFFGVFSVKCHRNALYKSNHVAALVTGRDGRRWCWRSPEWARW